MREMKWFAVRCCCSPKKVFGFILLPAETRSYALAVIPKPQTTWDYFAEKTAPEIIEGIERVVVEIKSIESMAGDFESAIYSEDRPIEFWRNVRGFVEVK